MRRAWIPVAPGFIDHKLAGGGPCMDIGVHALDLCMWLMDFPTPVRVSGVSRVNFAKGHKIPGMWGEWDRKRFSVEDFAAGFVHFKGGATMTVEAAWLGHQAENEDMSCQVFGTEGGRQVAVGRICRRRGSHVLPGDTDPGHSAGEGRTAEEIRAFHDCVVNDKPSPVPWTETIKVIAILEGIYKSSREQREVAIKI